MRTNLRKEVSDFANLMEMKLKLNEYKGGWDNDTIEDIYYKLKDELSELEGALDSKNALSIIDECVDIANYAMMIVELVDRDKNVEYYIK